MFLRRADEVRILTSSPGIKIVLMEAESDDERHRRYSRESPSPHYAALLEMYAQMHRDGYVQKVDDSEVEVAGNKSFAGEQLPKFLDPIKA